VGDTPEADVEGARAAGIRPILIAREAEPVSLAGVATVRSLSELIPLLAT
jgi:putative hydrolase of the HAD superfamily